MIDFGETASEVFRTLRAYDYTVMLYDEDGNQVYEPDDARRMFAKPENMLVSIIDDGDDSRIRVHLSKSTNIKDVEGFINTIRTIATKYNILSEVKRYGHELTPKQFATKHSVIENRNNNMKLVEGMYGTSRSSYLKLENAKMIVRHTAKVNEDVIGSRSRNIDQIFIENSIGERMLFPENNLGSARAMTQHISQGGDFADAVGKQILRMASDYSSLATCARTVYGNRSSLPVAAMDIRESCRCKMKNMRNQFSRIARGTSYDDEAEKIKEEVTALTEGEETFTIPENISAIVNETLSNLITDTNILETVCRTVAEDVDFAPKTNTINILGKDVDAQAWDNFKNGKLELLGQPENGSSPSFVDKTGEMLFKLGAVIPKVKNDSMLNLLSYVRDNIETVRDEQKLRLLRSIALHALKLSGIGMDTNLPRKEVVREFDEWMSSIGRIINEVNLPMKNAAEWHSRMGAARGNPTDGFDEDEIYRIGDEIISDFDVSEFLNDTGIEWVDSDSSDEITKTYVMGMLQSYLSIKFEDRGVMVDSRTTTYYGDMMWDAIATELGEMGYTVYDTDADAGSVDSIDTDDLDEAELSREDILLPREENPDTDLKSEVEVTHDNGYVDRIRSLSGLNGRIIPR